MVACSSVLFGDFLDGGMAEQAGSEFAFQEAAAASPAAAPGTAGAPAVPGILGCFKDFWAP
eukprot:10899896-Alexandrium_andersonii.AAC.1